VERRLAQVVSYLFHPLLMPTLGAILVFQVPPLNRINFNTQFHIAFYIITFGFTFLLPLVNCYILLRSGHIKSLRMETREERKLPFVITSVFYFAEYYMLSLNENIPQILKLLILGATLCVILTLIVNMFWKISAHMIGIGGLAGVLIAMSDGYKTGVNMFLISALLLAGLVGYARLRLNEHEPSQIYAGFLLGMFCQWGFLYFHFLK